MFQQDAPQFQKRLKVAIADRDRPGVRSATHALRGMLAYFSAEIALQIADRIDRMKISSSPARAQAAAADLDAEIERVVLTVRAGLRPPSTD